MKTAQMLAEDFRATGLCEGDNLIVHSSFKSLGPVHGGPATVVDALLQVLGPAGHLMTPAFTYSLPTWNAEPFDLKASLGRVGAIPEAVRRHARALRSFHPTHSVAVIGPEAEDIIKNHMHATPIGLESPFGRMCQRHAKILMLGTHLDTNSSIHYCEVAAPVSYIEVPFSPNQNYEIAWFYNEDGRIEYTQMLEVPGCSRGFRALEPPLISAGVVKEIFVGQTPAQLMEMDTFVPAVCDLLRQDPAMALCHVPSCAICPKRRIHVQKAKQ